MIGCTKYSLNAEEEKKVEQELEGATVLSLIARLCAMQGLCEAESA